MYTIFFHTPGLPCATLCSLPSIIIDVPELVSVLIFKAIFGYHAPGIRYSVLFFSSKSIRTGVDADGQGAILMVFNFI